MTQHSIISISERFDKIKTLAATVDCKLPHNESEAFRKALIDKFKEVDEFVSYEWQKIHLGKVKKNHSE